MINNSKWQTLAFLIGVLAYSLIGITYLNDHFVTEDVFELVNKRLDRIENKLDKVLTGE